MIPTYAGLSLMIPILEFQDTLERAAGGMVADYVAPASYILD